MTDESDDRIELSIPDADVLMPPDQHAVPATALPLLETHTLVTFGQAGVWWAIDTSYTVGAPRRDVLPGEESYLVVPFAESVQPRLRPKEYGEGVRGAHRRTSELWVYQDAAQEREITDVPPHNPMAWYDRVQSNDLTPPPIRRPRPARELPSLVGARVRVYGDGRWYWVIVVSEPLEVEDRIMVRALEIGRWHHVLVGQPLRDDEPYLISLHRLWAY